MSVACRRQAWASSALSPSTSGTSCKQSVQGQAAAVSSHGQQPQRRQKRAAVAAAVNTSSSGGSRKQQMHRWRRRPRHAACGHTAACAAPTCSGTDELSTSPITALSSELLAKVATERPPWPSNTPKAEKGTEPARMQRRAGIHSQKSANCVEPAPTCVLHHLPLPQQHVSSAPTLPCTPLPSVPRPPAPAAYGPT